MAVLFLISTTILLALYARKIFLHYKLLRITEDGKIDEDEDYFLTLLMSNKYFYLKVQSGSLTPITSHFTDELRSNLKNKINLLLKFIYYGLILYLTGILLIQIYIYV